MKTLSAKELNNLSTKRLLAVLKSARANMMYWHTFGGCECCGELFVYDRGQEKERLLKERQEKVDLAEEYFALVKSICNTREHVGKSK